jgi:hypothetical protein
VEAHGFGGGGVGGGCAEVVASVEESTPVVRDYGLGGPPARRPAWMVMGMKPEPSC